MILNAVLVGLALAISKFFQWYGWTFSDRPILCVSILGILLGRPAEGFILAAALELVFLGSIQMGGTVPQEYTIGAIFGAAFSMLLDQPVGIAITLAIPMSLLGVFLYNVMKVFFTALVGRFDQALMDHNRQGFLKLWPLFGIVYVIYYFLIGFLGILAGAHVVETVVNAIPEIIMNGLNVAAGMLPALGFAMLLKTLWRGDVAVFFFVGFAMAVFLNLPLIGVAFFAACIAVWLAINDYTQSKQAIGGPQAQVLSDEEEFFND